MSEEEILIKIEEIIEYSKLTTDIGIADQTDKIEAIQGLLELYQKEKEKNKFNEEWLNYYKNQILETNKIINSKIKEWLEYDKKYKTYTSDGRENFSIEYFKAKTLQELQELLHEGDK